MTDSLHARRHAWSAWRPDTLSAGADSLWHTSLTFQSSEEGTRLCPPGCAAWGGAMRCDSRALSPTAAYKALPVSLRWTLALSLAVGLALTLHWSQGSPRVVLRSPLHVSVQPLTGGLARRVTASQSFQSACDCLPAMAYSNSVTVVCNIAADRWRCCRWMARMHPRGGCLLSLQHLAAVAHWQLALHQLTSVQHDRHSEGSALARRVPGSRSTLR